jgi:hypothetical protein
MKLGKAFIHGNQLSLGFSFGMNVMRNIRVLLGKRGELPLKIRNTILGCSKKLMLQDLSEHSKSETYMRRFLNSAASPDLSLRRKLTRSSSPALAASKSFSRDTSD